MIIQTENKQRSFPATDLRRFDALLQLLAPNLSRHGTLPADLTPLATVTYVGEQAIRRLNKEQRGIDHVTDVLSFPLLHMREGAPTEALTEADIYTTSQGVKELSMGDILLCLPKAKKQAEEYGHSMDREVAFLVLHGLLHLWGYDHETPEDEKKMTDLQEKILDEIGITRDYIWTGEKPSVVESTVSGSDKRIKEKLRSEPALGDIIPHTGIVAILGRPNVGKSTLINHFFGMKIAIVTPKPQTTRTRILCTVNQKDAQIIFYDTPGIHKPKTALSNFMVDTAFQAAEDADIILYMVDAKKGRPSFVEREVCQRAAQSHKKIILALNKADAVVKEDLLPLIAAYNALYPFEAIIPISARTADGVDALLSLIKNLLPPGPMLYPSEEMTDQSEREIASELIREQLIAHLDDEIPYGTAVEIESFEESYADDASDEYDRKLIRIRAALYCDRNSHKGIILGKKGQMIKSIGTKARENIEKMCGCKVYLELFVKVREDWKNRDVYLKNLGYKV